MSLSLLKNQLNHKSMAERMQSHITEKGEETLSRVVASAAPMRKSKKQRVNEAHNKNKELMLLRKTKAISKEKYKKVMQSTTKQARKSETNDFKSSLQILQRREIKVKNEQKAKNQIKEKMFKSHRLSKVIKGIIGRK